MEEWLQTFSINEKKRKMKSIIIYVNIILITIFSSCSTTLNDKKNTNCGISITQFLENDSTRLQVSERANGVIIQLVDKSNDSETLGSYHFYPNGNLKSYKFLTSATKYSYNEEYDSTGNITSIEGSPLLLHLFRKIDSSIVRFTFFFSTLNKEYKNIIIKTNIGVEFNAELLSNVVFTNIKSVTFNLPVAKNFKDVVIYTNCELINTCLNKQWALKDTATFKDASL